MTKHQGVISVSIGATNAQFVKGQEFDGNSAFIVGPRERDRLQPLRVAAWERLHAQRKERRR